MGGTPLPANVNVDVTLGFKAAVWTLAGSYRVRADARYAFPWGDVVGAWRDLDYKMKSGKIENINFDGPTIAFVLHW